MVQGSRTPRRVPGRPVAAAQRTSSSQAIISGVCGMPHDRDAVHAVSRIQKVPSCGDFDADRRLHITGSRDAGPVDGDAAPAAATVGLAVLCVAAAPPALAHAGERGFILLLPTGLFQIGGTIAVAVSFLVVRGFVPARCAGIESVRRPLFRVPRTLRGSNAVASAVLVRLSLQAWQEAATRSRTLSRSRCGRCFGWG